MKRAHVLRFAAVIAAIALVAACDQRAPVTPTIKGGGSGGSVKGAPVVSIDTVQPSPVNVGDSILVAVHVIEDSSIASVVIQGLTVKGDVNLGTLFVGNRYTPVSVSGFRPALKDTVIRRYLHPGVPVDTSLDSLVLVATATDNSGKQGADTVVVRVVTGPHVQFINPLATSQAYAGGDMSVVAEATHPDGVSTITIKVKSLGTWPTPVNDSITASYSPIFPKDTTLSTVTHIPLNAPLNGRLQFQASAVDINGKPGSIALITLLVKGQDTTPPLVTQVVSPRIELNDSVLVYSSGSSATMTVGVIVKDSAGVEIRRDSITVPVANQLNSTSNWIHLPLTAAEQGRRLRISTFAIDRNGRKGYSVSSGTVVAQGVMARAYSDTTIVVYGTTFPIPNTPANAPMGDVVVDPVHGNVFLSNINYNRLEVWHNASKTFGTSIPVGSQPWGMAFSNNPDTLYVANSGGTNLSRVYVGSGTMGEDLPHRMLTRDSYLFNVTQTLDKNTSRLILDVGAPISYSDRPQYIAVAASGRIYYSTVPTTVNPAGTIRWLDPAYPWPDPHQIWQYGGVNTSATSTWVVMNVDSISVIRTSVVTSDTIVLYDHPYGQKTGVLTARNPDVLTAVAQLAALGSDVEAVSGLDVSSLALTDTTFVGISGDRTWIAFGEGNTSGAGRIMMVNDPSGSMPGFLSPSLAVRDILDNAAEHVYGIAVDSTGQTVGSHGAESYFSSIELPFHLRLQGKYDSFDNGAGIAFSPGANGYTTPSADRLAFVGSQSGFIEIVDIANFINRGRLTLKGNLYGPLRVSRPFAGDPPGVVLKLFGLSSTGLVVIDLTAADIKPAP